jgi:hypothetical protein
MSDFAEIPPPLYEQVDGSPAATTGGEALSAQYKYFEDREAEAHPDRWHGALR